MNLNLAQKLLQALKTKSAGGWFPLVRHVGNGGAGATLRVAEIYQL